MLPVLNMVALTFLAWLPWLVPLPWLP